MTQKSPSLRSKLGAVRGLGSAKNGTEHWWMLRVTSLALVPLGLYFAVSFFNNVVDGGYESATYWLRSPFSATFMILFLATAFHHAANGMQVVFEDYVKGHFLRHALIFGTKFVCLGLVILGVLATLKVLFGV